MSKYQTIINLLREGPYAFFCALFDKLRYMRILRNMSDESFLRMVYRVHFRKSLDLNNPQSFNEKLQWLKLHNRKNEYITMVDKCAVKDYVSNIIGNQYIIKNYGVWDSFDDIDFNSLPEKFVLKCNHDSGSVIICNEKSRIDKKRVRSILESGLKRNLFYWGREWPYKNVKPCIFAEELLEDDKDGDLKDYKFFCFHGRVKCFKIDFGRFTEHHANYFDVQGNVLSISEKVCTSRPDYKLNFPENLEEMIVLAEQLSKDIPFLRVDFYSIKNRLFFGELTFYPASGLSPFEDYRSDLMMGKWLNLEDC